MGWGRVGGVGEGDPYWSWCWWGSSTTPHTHSFVFCLFEGRNVKSPKYISNHFCHDNHLPIATWNIFCFRAPGNTIFLFPIEIPTGPYWSLLDLIGSDRETAQRGTMRWYMWDDGLGFWMGRILITNRIPRWFGLSESHRGKYIGWSKIGCCITDCRIPDCRIPHCRIPKVSALAAPKSVDPRL